MLKRVCAAVFFVAFLCSSVSPVLASNTGSVRGRVLDATTGAPIAGATVTAESPQQRATTVSDSAGDFRFISLSPDTYVLHASAPKYDPGNTPGVVVFADQSITANVTLTPTLKTIASVKTRNNQSLVRAGTTSDVYSVNANGVKTTQAAAGAGSMNQAYAAISTVPGVNISSNQQGWYQNIYVRGGNIDQVAYEFDGLPVMRQSDLGAITTLTTLGMQEVQVYTGGTPATSNSSGLAGYINQVVKTGTYPGYADVSLGIASPAFYHSAVAEVSGATPDRMFSYYAGFAGANQDYRYYDQFGGVGQPLYFYPLAVPTTNSGYNILDGHCAAAKNPTCSAPNYGFAYSPGFSYGQATNYDRENVVNLHFGIAHKNSPIKDDVQLLYVVGGINTWFYSNQYELYPATVKAAFGEYPMPYLESVYYAGKVGQAPDSSQLTYGPFPFAQTTPRMSSIPVSQRDGSFNGYSIEKAQYQKNFNDRSYLRVHAYAELSNWFISAPASAELAFGAELADYEVNEHAYGGGLTYSNQLSTRHLLTGEYSYMTQKLQTYNAQFSSTDPNTPNLAPTGLGTVLSSFVDSKGNCYNYVTGQRWSCFDTGSQGGCLNPIGCYSGNPQSPNINLTPGNCVAASNCTASNAATRAGAHWVMTENGQSAQVDNVQPTFQSAALTDLWQPNDTLTFNIGVRLDRFAYARNNLEDATRWPERAFWFNAYNREHCGALGFNPYYVGIDPSTGRPNACPSGYSPMTNPGNGLYNVSSDTNTSYVFQPRVSGTWALNPDTVVRASYGKYARAEASSYFQYNTFQQNLASFIAQFYADGYHTPNHDLQPDTSNNFDLSLEKHLHGTNMSFKITPFYRNTQNQLQFQAIDPLGGTLAGLNVGTQQSYGIEFAFQSGDFTRDGLSYQISYTNTTSRINFHPINGISVIDSLNKPIEQYNSYTKACAGVTAGSPNWAACGSGQYAGNAQPTFTNPCNGSKNCTVTVANPYYNAPIQALLDPNGSYSPQNVIASPFNAANSYETPNVLSAVLNYRKGRWAITPTLRWDDGASYGSPLTWPGYVPQSCYKNPAAYPATPGAFCPGDAVRGGALMIPDPYNGNKFDTPDQWKDPSQLTLNLQTSYELNSRVSFTVSAVNVYNKCYQRGYAWDQPNTCSYGVLPSNIMPPVGNFLQTTSAGVPVNGPKQLRYPYGTFFDITEVGQTSVIQPFGVFANVTVRL